MINWWAYLHTNGRVQVKRYFGDPLDLEEAQESPFVVTVMQPFPAINRESAVALAEDKLL